MAVSTIKTCNHWFRTVAVCANLPIYAPRTRFYDHFRSKSFRRRSQGHENRPMAQLKQGRSRRAPLITWTRSDKVEKAYLIAGRGSQCGIATGSFSGGEKRHAPGAALFSSTPVLSNCPRPTRLWWRTMKPVGPLAPLFRFKDEATVIREMCNNSTVSGP